MEAFHEQTKKQTNKQRNKETNNQTNKQTRKHLPQPTEPPRKKTTYASLTGDTPKDQVAMKELWPARAEKVFQMDALLDNSHTPVRHKNNTWPEQAEIRIHQPSLIQSMKNILSSSKFPWLMPVGNPLICSARWPLTKQLWVSRTYLYLLLIIQ